MRGRLFLYGGVAVSLAAALVTLREAAPEAASASLQARFTAYWQARVQQDLPRALQYEHPAQRQQLGQAISQARRRSGVKVTAVTVLDPQAFQLAPTVAEAGVALRIAYEYTFPSRAAGPLATSTVVVDTWRKEGGIWYHVLQTEVG